MHRFGIAGHCVLDPDAREFVASACSALIVDAQRAGKVAAVSALAEGADTMFAEAALSAGATLEIVRPYHGFEREFNTARLRRRYRVLVDAAHRETALPFGSRSTRAYEAAMRRIADSCDVLVAAWDGTPPRGTGGTADTVRYAESIGRRVVHLDVVRHRVIVRGSAG
jgi:hypothetical protein